MIQVDEGERDRQVGGIREVDGQQDRDGDHHRHQDGPPPVTPSAIHDVGRHEGGVDEDEQDLPGEDSPQMGWGQHQGHHDGEDDQTGKEHLDADLHAHLNDHRASAVTGVHVAPPVQPITSKCGRSHRPQV